MSYGLKYSEAMGHYYIDPYRVLHIKASMPEKMRESFVKQMMADREKARKRNRDGRLEFMSGDVDFDEIVYDN